jgi:glycosyltransferase involved in cell wall biosynthesis
MKNKTVSVIIPVRNAEKYVEKCVKSVQSQTHTDLDIIIVLNDSSDQSEVICRNIESIDPRVRVVSVNEAGVSRARNVGIESALGDYVMFIDVDDFIHDNLIQHLYTEVNKRGSDIAVANFEKYDVKALGNERDNRLTNRIVLANDYAQGMLLGSHGYDGYIWGKIYRTKILSNIRFNERLMFSEDTDFLLKVLRQNVSIFISPFVGYFYSQDTGGITKDTSGNQRLGSLALSEAFIREAIDSKVRSAAQCYCWRSTYYILSQSSVSSSDQNRIWDVMKKYRMAVIMNALSPAKYRAIAILSLFGKDIFIKTVSRVIGK